MSRRIETPVAHRILPNLRDLAVSSGMLGRMRQGVLFRSARHFAADSTELASVLCDELNIKSVIDLRDDDLSKNRAELLSRQILQELYGLGGSLKTWPTKWTLFEPIPDDPKYVQFALMCGIVVGREGEQPVTKRIRSSQAGSRVSDNDRTKLLPSNTIDSVNNVKLDDPSIHNDLNQEKPNKLDSTKLGLKDIEFDKIDSKDVELNNIDLQDVKLDKVDSNGVELNKAGSKDVELNIVDSKNVSLNKANSKDVELDKADSKDVKLDKVDQRNVEFDNKTDMLDEVLNKVQIDQFGSNSTNIDIKQNLSGAEHKPESNNTNNSNIPKTIIIKKSRAGRNIVASYSSEKPFGWEAKQRLERQRRKLFIVNILNSKAAKSRIHQELRQNVLSLPVILTAHLWSRDGPYWFCKLIMSRHKLVETYEEMFKYCGENICWTLKIITVAEYPLLFHCTLGKDRTGIISILLLATLGCDDDHIAMDFELSQSDIPNSFAKFIYHFIVTESGLSPHFCEAPREAAYHCLEFLREKFGSVSGYLEHIGFSRAWRTALRKRLLDVENPLDLEVFDIQCEKFTSMTMAELQRRMAPFRDQHIESRSSGVVAKEQSEGAEELLNMASSDGGAKQSSQQS